MASGVGEERARQAEQQSNINAQLQANQMRINADREMAVIDAQNRRDAMQFQSFLTAESAKREMAWEREKVELSQRHDFDMLEQRKDIENQFALESELKDRAKINSKFTALDDAVKRGDISKEDSAKEKIRLQLELPPSASPFAAKSKDAMDEFIKQLTEKKSTDTPVYEKAIVPPQTKVASELAKSLSSPDFTEEDKKEIKEVLKRGNPTEIQQANEIIQAKKRSIEWADISKFSFAG